MVGRQVRFALDTIDNQVLDLFPGRHRQFDLRGERRTAHTDDTRLLDPGKNLRSRKRTFAHELLRSVDPFGPFIPLATDRNHHLADSLPVGQHIHPASAINSPTFTLSPLATFATAGAPICCDKGTFTTSGNASTSTASARLNLLSDGCTPPLGNVFIAFVFGFIVRIRIRFFQSSSPPKPASLPLPTFASMQERL